MNSRTRAVLAASIGNMLEWYDFTVYAAFALYIGRLFFPPQDTGAGLVKAFLAFGVGFIIRPLGAILIGNYADRAGRKAALTLTIAMMAGGTGLIALSPTYVVLGFGAPLLLFLGRVLQGFSAGGEVGGATAYLLESADQGRRGLSASWLEASMGLSNILGALTALLVASLLSRGTIEAWGWRIPFLLGLLIVPAGLYLRRTLGETEEFRREAEMRQNAGTARAPVLEALRNHYDELAAGFALSILWAVAVYVLIVYLPVYVQVAFKFTATQAFTASLIGNVFFTVGCLGSGVLSDRLGRRPLLLTSSGLLLLAVLPLLLWLRADPHPVTLIAVQTVLCILVSGFVGVAPAALAESFPTGIRSTGVSLTYNAAFTVFGGFAPGILTWLTQKAGASVLAPAWYVMAAAAVALAAIVLSPVFTRPGPAGDPDRYSASDRLDRPR